MEWNVNTNNDKTIWGKDEGNLSPFVPGVNF